ncbi:MAG: VOC family protein [Gammaproteobacteria bacterium]
MILGFGHPGIVVSDLERAREFYQRMFGFHVIGTEGWDNSEEFDRAIGLSGSATRGYMMAGHNCFLELWEFSAPPQSAPAPASLGAHEPGIRHLAFYVDDCQRECARLIELGGTLVGEPAGNVDVGYAAYCRDPFGNLIELAEVPTEAERLDSLPGVSRVGRFEG